MVNKNLVPDWSPFQIHVPILFFVLDFSSSGNLST